MTEQQQTITIYGTWGTNNKPAQYVSLEEWQKLERELADLKACQAWRPIADGMPPSNVPVLILAKTYLYDEPIVCAASWNSCGLDKTVYWNCHGASGMGCENVFDTHTITHWQPLPETPKGSDE